MTDKLVANFPLLMAIMALSALVGFGSAARAESAGSGPPQVGDTYQRFIDKAWEEAGEFHNPTMTCASMKGRIAGTGDSNAFKALFACNVEIPARYFDAYLDKVEAGEKSCQEFMSGFLSGLSAMTIDTGTLLQMAEALSAEGHLDAALTETMTVAAEDAVTEKGLKDPKRLVKDRLSERTQNLCPDIAPYVVR